MKKETLIIIGGGAAGLMTANELAERYNVILLEAKQRLGGRIWTRTLSHAPHIIEAGAEFIHGHQELTLRLLQQAGIKYVEVKGKMYHRENGVLKEQTEMIEDWDKLLKEMKTIKTDMTMHDFLYEYFGGDEYADLRRHAIAYAEGFDLADIRRASVQALYKEWKNQEETNFRIPLGYGAMITYLEQSCLKKGCSIITGKTIKQVDWEKNDITVYTAGEEKFTGDKLVVTVPLAILATTAGACALNFTPPLDEYISAARNTGTGEVIKIICWFKERFWKKDLGFVFSDEIFPTWWTQLPSADFILTGWAGGSRAQQLKDCTREELLQKATASLAAIFDMEQAAIKNRIAETVITNWQAPEPGLYGYSYRTLKSKAALEVLNTPVEDTIYFCGEGLYKGKSPGTVEAALVSAMEVSKQLRRDDP